eukprot:5218860-Pleurochrysis_carterae.AAC.5
MRCDTSPRGRLHQCMIHKGIESLNSACDSSSGAFKLASQLSYGCSVDDWPLCPLWVAGEVFPPFVTWRLLPVLSVKKLRKSKSSVVALSAQGSDHERRLGVN